MKKTISGLALMLLAACGSSNDGKEVLAEADASGNVASATLENQVEQRAATPLQKEEALALMKERHENYEKIG